MSKRIVLLLAVTALVVTMLAVGAGTALAGKGLGGGGGNSANQKDVKAEKTRTGGGPLHNPHV